MILQVQKEAVQSVEQDGMVFIDEIDKIVVGSEMRYGKHLCPLHPPPPPPLSVQCQYALPVMRWQLSLMLLRKVQSSYTACNYASTKVWFQTAMQSLLTRNTLLLVQQCGPNMEVGRTQQRQIAVHLWVPDLPNASTHQPWQSKQTWELMSQQESSFSF